MNVIPVVLSFAALFTIMRVMPRLTVSRGRQIQYYAALALAGFIVSVLPLPFARWLMPMLWWLVAAVLFVRLRGELGRWTRDAQAHAIVLDAPFVGEWQAVIGGPSPRRNHHLIASDQRFAYDFVREDGESFGTPILAPIAGTVSSTHDGVDDRPEQRSVHETRLKDSFGNCVAIESAGATVFLCHLQRDSVLVAVGERVELGQRIGSCGNSGRTSVSHLHIHAQRESQPAPFRGTGVPIAFRIDGAPRVLDADDFLTGPPAALNGETPVLTAQ